MKKGTLITCLVCWVATATLVYADDTEMLIQLDKKWGESQGSEDMAAYLTDTIVALDEDGVANKAQLLEQAASDDTPAGPYVAGDYQVRFLSDDMAVMVHSTGMPNPHWSMHLWQKHDGKWQVAATASVPMKK